MNVEQIAAAEHRLHLAEEALSAAAVRKDRQSISLHEYRVMRAEEALTKARHAEEYADEYADEYGDCRCALCRGVTSWDD